MYTVAHIAARAARASTSSCRPPLVTAAAATRPITRSFASTTYRRASEVPKDPMADPQIQQFYEKLRNHQGAVDAMMKLAELMKSKGIDTTQPPSKMQMLKLGFDKDIREAGQNLVEQMKQAGVEMNPDMLKALYGRMKE